MDEWGEHVEGLWPAVGCVFFKELMLLSWGVYLSLIWLWSFHSPHGRLMLNNQRWWCPDKAQGHRDYFPSRRHWFGFNAHKYWWTAVWRGPNRRLLFSQSPGSLFPPWESMVSFNTNRRKITRAVNQKSVLLQFHIYCVLLFRMPAHYCWPCLLVCCHVCTLTGSKVGTEGPKIFDQSSKKERKPSGGMALLSLCIALSLSISCNNDAYRPAKQYHRGELWSQ